MRTRKCATLRRKRVGRERAPDTKTFICRVAYATREKKNRRAKSGEKKGNEKKVGHHIRLFEYRVSRSRRAIIVASGFTTSRGNFVGHEIASRLDCRSLSVSAHSVAGKTLRSVVLSAAKWLASENREKGRCTKTPALFQLGLIREFRGRLGTEPRGA